MRKRTTTLAGLGAAAVLVVGLAVPADAAISRNFGANNCVWPTHTFLEMKSAGTQNLSVKATGGAGWSTNAWPNSATSRRNYVNSLSEDAEQGFASTSAGIWEYARYGCSV